MTLIEAVERIKKTKHRDILRVDNDCSEILTLGKNNPFLPFPAISCLPRNDLFELRKQYAARKATAALTRQVLIERSKDSQDLRSQEMPRQLRTRKGN